MRSLLFGLCSRFSGLRAFLLFSSLFFAGQLRGQDQLEFPADVRQWFINYDGSCVWCAISEAAVWQNCPQGSTLLYNTEYGPAVRGGSWPSRVESVCNQRGIPIYNVAGEGTFEFAKWAAKTGRMAAIGCFDSHFQTLLWYNPDPRDKKPWKIANNWVSNFDRNYEYTEEEFRNHHLRSGRWVVVLKTAPPPPANPIYVKWWEVK